MGWHERGLEADIVSGLGYISCHDDKCAPSQYCRQGSCASCDLDEVAEISSTLNGLTGSVLLAVMACDYAAIGSSACTGCARCFQYSRFSLGTHNSS